MGGSQRMGRCIVAEHISSSARYDSANAALVASVAISDTERFLASSTRALERYVLEKLGDKLIEALWREHKDTLVAAVDLTAVQPLVQEQLTGAIVKALKGRE